MVSAAALIVASAAGCASSRKAETTWAARPTVDWRRISSIPLPALHDEYRIVASGPTIGLFPANLAVTRVAVEESSESVDGSQPKLFADPRNEFLQWNRAFDDQMALSEVFPIDQRDLGGGPADPEQIVAAFRALHARLGLIYAVNELSPTESEIIGALYDTGGARVLAAFHARAASVEPVPGDSRREAKKASLWETDSRALVRARFETLVYAALRELILNDQPSRTDPPEGWTPAGPIRPVVWPPRQYLPPPP